MPIPFLGKKKMNREEQLEEDEYLDRELSIEQKRAMIRELRRRGQDPKNFSDNKKMSGISFTRVWNWLKQH